MIQTYLPWLLSAITIWMTVLAGNKHTYAWAIGLVNQTLWLIWIISTATWGLIPMNVALWIVYTRNQLKWLENEEMDVKEQRMMQLWLTSLRNKMEAGMHNEVMHELDIALGRIESEQRTTVTDRGEEVELADAVPTQRTDSQPRGDDETVPAGGGGSSGRTDDG